MSRIIIFGCGGVGSKAKQKLEAEGNEIICFTDNSSSKWESSFEGKKVIAPKTILQENFDYIAIGIYKAADLIRRQLNEMGIDNGRIIIPIEPDRIFPSTIPVSKEKLKYLEQSEYLSRNTQEYQKLNIQINDYEFLQKLDSLKKTLEKNNIPREKVCIVSGAILQVLGLRKSKEFDDIDIIMTSDLRKLYGSGLVIVSDSAEMHVKDEYNISDDEIIKNETYHFIFSDLKFMHPQILLKHLKDRGGEEYDMLRKVDLWSIVDVE